MQKPNLTMVSVELRFREPFSFDLWPTNHINFARFHVQTSNNLKNYKHWYNLYCLEKYKPINALADAAITAKFVPCETQTYQCCK